MIVLGIIYFAMICLTVKKMAAGENKAYITHKIITSAIFLVAAAIVAISTKSDLMKFMIPGYICCFVGDVLLAIAHEIDNKLINPQFTIGVVFFAIAHGFYIYTFGGMLDWQVAASWIIIPAALVSYTLYTAFKSDAYDYGDNKISTAGYSLIVGTCCGIGIDMIAKSAGNKMMMVLGIGAVLFTISDFILSNKFFKKQTSDLVKDSVLFFYYIGVFCLIIGFKL